MNRACDCSSHTKKWANGNHYCYPAPQGSSTGRSRRLPPQHFEQPSAPTSAEILTGQTEVCLYLTSQLATKFAKTPAKLIQRAFPLRHSTTLESIEELTYHVASRRISQTHSPSHSRNGRRSNPITHRQLTTSAGTIVNSWIKT